MNRNQRRMAAYNARKSSEHIERYGYIKRIDRAFTKLSEGCTAKVALAINGPSVRDVKEVEFVTREDPQYRKVKNPYGQHINARQKQRGYSIPLI